MFSLLALTAGALAGSVAAQSSSSAAAAVATSKAATATTAAANADSTILVDKTFTWGDLPYKVDTDPTGRGPQSGYNICNSTTVGPDSQCQTAFINSPSDFCLWGPADPNGEIGDIEASSVAYCTTPDHGTRVMPANTITALQFLTAPAYIQVTGLINQANIDEDPNDSGGELDPHGADGRGNPLGALVFTSAFPQSNGNLTDYLQVIEWHSFMGSGIFCFKACNPNVAGSKAYCDNLFDLLGCEYNAPAAYAPGVFESCLSDNQDPPGTYTGSDGVVSTFTQPPDGTPITSMPYQPKVPATSSCTTLTSASLFTAAASASVSGSTAATATGAAASSAATAKTSTGTGTTAKSTSTSTSTSSTSAAGSQFEVAKLGGVAIIAIGALVGAIMVV
ncbi:hypothetical protein FRB94_007282 [Tulasnella sp. JGI-2019a]|nr:hypothetical protein FRB93_001623 [Tulasnella sp. JGI-2019a]KAG8997979.1 hypothetical protein FRB94_007282 [Tulasnella sp. JGI-2019a]KAG9035536.1 hypothetical protein FRB95_011078 [Tulasnella sp. JGI-2019a]